MASTSNPSDPQGQEPRRSGRLPSDAEPGEIIEQQVVRVEGEAQVVHREAVPGEIVPGEAVQGTVISREIIPNATIAAQPEAVSSTTRFEAETIHSEVAAPVPFGAPVEPGLTQDVYTVGETFDPITHNPCDLHGIMVEFEDSETLLEAVRSARKAGYRKMDCYSPIPVEGLTDEMGWKDKKVPALMLCGGLTGFTLAWILQFAGMAWFYPVNIGGKPLNSWPQFVVPAFEMTILFTALTGVVSMIVLNGLPSPYHPVFNVPGFDAASSDRFFLCLEHGDEKWNRVETLQFARTLGGLRVSEVAR